MLELLNSWRSTETQDKILAKQLSLKDHKILANFETKLSFGTSGIRGIMGAGTNRINEFTIAAAASAYANYLLGEYKNKKQKGIVIGHDNRHNSKLFSKITASVFQAVGIKAYLFDNNDIQPTPLVSYVVRNMKLMGGVVITASHNTKEYNGFKTYNSLGSQLLEKETLKIKKIMDGLDPLKIKRSKKSIEYLPKEIETKYLDTILKRIPLRKDQKTIKVAFSPLHGASSSMVPKVLNKLGYENYSVKKQSETNPDFKYAKSSNPEDVKAYNKVIALARKKRAQIAITTDPDADRVGIVVKYKKRYKYLNGNQIAALYLDYKLTQLKEQGKLPEDGYIIKTNVSGNLPAKIAQKFGIKVYETHVGFKNIAHLIENTEGTFVLAYEESYGMLLSKNIARDKDSIQAIVGICEMTNYYNEQNKTLFSKLKQLYEVYGIYRTSQKVKVLSSQMTTRLLNRMTKLKKIANKKVVKVIDYRKAKGKEYANLVKLFLKNDSWVAIRPSGTEPIVKIYIQTTGTKKQTLMDVVSFEKEVQNIVEDNTETFEPKKWAWKKFIKYAIFAIIIIGILALVFKLVYPQGKGGNIWEDAWEIINLKSRWLWLSSFLYIGFTTFINAQIRKKLIMVQGQKVKIRHLIISGLMSSIISYVTPLSIGGDAIGYWYLRRKGIKRGPLLSSFILATIIWQFGFILQTAILLPIGIPLYKDVLFASSSESNAAFILFCVGLSWDVFATFMITSLSLWKRFQNFIVSKTIKFLEWLPFVHISDPGQLTSKYQYEFGEMRKGIKTIFHHKKILIETVFYELLPKFVNGIAIILIVSNLVKSNYAIGPYWIQIVAYDMQSTANTISLTPGGSGTQEWLSININKHIFEPVINNSTNETASAVDLAQKLTSGWPMLAISGLLIPTIIVGENRNKKYATLTKNAMLENKTIKKTSSRYYKIISIVWVCLIVGAVATFLLI